LTLALCVYFVLIVKYPVISSMYPFISRVRYSSPIAKIISFFLAFSACFVVLSISVEGLFFSAYVCNLLLWIEVEVVVRSSLAGTSENGTTSASSHRHLAPYCFRADDIRIALFFLFYVQVAFFGTGKWVLTSFEMPRR